MWVHVTAEAVFKFEMGLSRVALGALRDLAMDWVTDVTANRGMFALVVPELSILLRVTGKANIFIC